MAWTIPLFYLLTFLLSTVSAQVSEATCLPYYDWASNSQGQTPCQVASSLLAECTADKTFKVLPLALGQHYRGPALVSSANDCICNTVVFSLMTACGLCQGRTVLRWSEWASNCPHVTIGNYPRPIPRGLRIPGWAYQNVKDTDVFDQFVARENANATESTASPIPSTTKPSDEAKTISLVTETTSETQAAETEAANDANESQRLSKANKVGGAVVGSLLGVALLVGGLLFFVKRRARRARRGERLNSDRGSQAESQTASMKHTGEAASGLPSIRVSS